MVTKGFQRWQGCCSYKGLAEPSLFVVRLDQVSVRDRKRARMSLRPKEHE